jgi:hypothetical protein
MAEPRKDPARLGGRIALTIFGVVVVAVVAMWTTQITLQVFATKTSADAKESECRTGLVALSRALDAARAASERVESSPEDAISRFRAALSPAWDDHDHVAAMCQHEGRAELLQALDTFDRLRYAEVNAIRRDARDLGFLRRRARALRDTVLGAP